jgi:hypothetical protein
LFTIGNIPGGGNELEWERCSALLDELCLYNGVVVCCIDVNQSSLAIDQLDDELQNMAVPGLMLISDFVSLQEEAQLVTAVDQRAWSGCGIP